MAMNVGNCKVLADHLKRENHCRPSSIASSREYVTTHLKVDICPIIGSHDWIKCPYTHKSENARRRNPAVNQYTEIPCVLFDTGICVYGDSCPMAHGAIETQLHPAYFQTLLCRIPGCEGGVVGCCSAHLLAELNFEYAALPDTRAPARAMAAQLKEAHAILESGADLANDDRFPYSVKYAVMTSKSAELCRLYRPEKFMEQCGGRAAAHPPAGRFSTRRHELQIPYDCDEQRSFMLLDDGMEYFKEAIKVEYGAEAVPVPRMSKDLARGLRKCAPTFEAARAFDTGLSRRPSTVNEQLSLSTEQTLGREFLGPRSKMLDMLAGCLQFRLQNETAFYHGGYWAVPMFNGSTEGRVSAVWDHTPKEGDDEEAYLASLQTTCGNPPPDHYYSSQHI